MSPLILGEWRDWGLGKELVIVKNGGFDEVVRDGHLLVGIEDGKTNEPGGGEGLRSGGEVGNLKRVDAKLRELRAENEPDNEKNDGGDDEDDDDSGNNGSKKGEASILMGRIVGVSVVGRIGVRRSSVGVGLAMRLRIGGRGAAVGVSRVAGDRSGGVCHGRSDVCLAERVGE